MMETENNGFNQFQNQQVNKFVTIKCSLCDLAFNPEEAKTNICPRCIINSTDITLGITKEGIVNFCRFCRRYLRPPWTICERESKELMSICLRRLRGLARVKIIDSAFVYTEPSTKRIKVRLTVQKEVMNNTNLQQTFVCEFAEHYQQCDDCKKEFTPHTWGASVQIRQKVSHKKTFFYLEQLLLKHQANDKVLKIENVDDGLDFFYKTRSHAARLVDFLGTVLPIKIKQSKQLVSHDMNNNIHNYKYSFSVEIPKICKDDLVIIPQKLAKELGGVCRVQICYKISTIIHLLDPITLKSNDLSLEQYQLYENEFELHPLKFNGSTFTVVDCEKLNNTNLNESYLNSTMNTFINKVYNLEVIREDGDYIPIQCKSYLGDVLKPGMQAVGYDLGRLVVEEIEGLKNLPEIIILKKKVDKESRKKRIFKVKRLEQENKMDEEGAKKKKIKDVEKEQEDYEEFLDEVGKDKEMRKNINLYRNEDAISKLTEKELKLKEKHRVQKGRKIIQANKRKSKVQEEQIKPLDNQGKEKEKEEWVSDSDYDDNEVKLEELMKDLNLTETAVVNQQPFQEDQSQIDDFISKLDKVKIIN